MPVCLIHPAWFISGSAQFDVFVRLLRAFEAVVYVLKVPPESSYVLFNLLGVFFVDHDAFDELGDVDHLILFHA
jgi:hypothetical protein